MAAKRKRTRGCGCSLGHSDSAHREHHEGALKRFNEYAASFKKLVSSQNFGPALQAAIRAHAEAVRGLNECLSVGGNIDCTPTKAAVVRAESTIKDAVAYLLRR